MDKKRFESSYVEAASGFNEAQDFYMNGEYKKSLHLIESVVDMYKTLHEKVEPLPILLGLSYRLQGEGHLALLDYEKAGQSFSLSLEVFEEAEDEVNVMMEKQNIMRVERTEMVNKGTLRDAAVDENVVKTLMKNYPDGPTSAQKKSLELVKAASAAFGEGELEKAKEIIDEALVLTEELGPFIERKSTLTIAGDIYSVLKKHNESADLYKEALRIGSGYDEKDVELMLSLGNEYSNQNLLEEALQLYEESLELATKIQNIELQARSQANIGSVYARQGIKEKALLYFMEAKGLFSSIDGHDMVKRMDSTIAHYEL